MNQNRPLNTEKSVFKGFFIEKIKKIFCCCVYEEAIKSK
jgi:hypothetical protein